MQADLQRDVRTIRDGLATQIRVIRALFFREIITRYGRRNLGFAWLFIEPALFVIVVTAIWTATRSIHQSQIPIAALTLTGYTSMQLWRNTPGRCIGALSANGTLLHHSRVKMLDIYLARILLEFAGVTTAFVVLAYAMWLTGWIELPEKPLQVMAGWILLAWFGLGMALTLGPLSERFPIIQKLWPLVAILLFIFSGVSFLLDTLPPQIRGWMLWLPMANGLEYLREGFFGSFFKAHYDLLYLITVNLSLTAFGLTQVKRVKLNEIAVQ